MINLRSSEVHGGILIIAAIGLFLFAFGIIPQMPPADPTVSPVFYAFKNALKDLFFYMGAFLSLVGVIIYFYEESFGMSGHSGRVRNEGGDGDD